MTDPENAGSVGFRVHWRGADGGLYIGELWPDRQTAAHVARMLAASGYVTDVRVEAARA